VWKLISVAAVAASAVVWSSVSEALPPKKNTFLLCKCTCRAEDELGKLHYGGGVTYTTSHDECDVFPSCTVGSQHLPGIATDCLGYERSLTIKPLPNSLPKLQIN
jgi:hypothetical protein